MHVCMLVCACACPCVCLFARPRAYVPVFLLCPLWPRAHASSSSASCHGFPAHSSLAVSPCLANQCQCIAHASSAKRVLCCCSEFSPFLSPPQQDDCALLFDLTALSGIARCPVCLVQSFVMRPLATQPTSYGWQRASRSESSKRRRKRGRRRRLKSVRRKSTRGRWWWRGGGRGRCCAISDARTLAETQTLSTRQLSLFLCLSRSSRVPPGVAVCVCAG